MKTFLIFCFFCLFLITPYPSFPDNNFTFDYDYCFFRNDDPNQPPVILEFYYSFYQNQLIFIRSGNEFEADGLIELNIINKSINKPVIQKNYKVPLIIPDTTGYNKKLKLTGQINMLLDSGSYKFYIKAADFNDTARFVSYEKDIDIPGFDDKNVTSSSLQFAANIRKSDDPKSIFYKNTLEVIPNPSRLFGNNLSELYYYIEFYNLTKENLTGEYSVNTVVTDLNNNTLKSETKNFMLKNNSRVVFGHINISDIKTGIYKFAARLLDSTDNLKTEAQNQFVIYNTDTSSVSNANVSEKDFLASEYVNYPEDKLDKEFEYAVYIMSDAFKNQYSKVKDITAKRKLMFEFWKSFDPDPLTPLNEYKQQYLERVDYANKNFRGNYVDGWKTDRGRVYIVYGKYSDIERHPFEPSTRAYEIWKYDYIQGGVIFVFIDLSNESGNYILVHSTARNELRDDDWQRRLNVRR